MWDSQGFLKNFLFRSQQYHIRISYQRNIFDDNKIYKYTLFTSLFLSVGWTFEAESRWEVDARAHNIDEVISNSYLFIQDNEI